jgi:cytosine/adenosine deaminase-related metal-dependent hydrolase
LDNLGVSGEKSIFVHCVHIDEAEMEIIAGTNTIVVHNPESNMNNAVGVTRLLDLLRRGILVGLGTDGMSSDMLSQMRCAYLLHRLANRDPRVAFMEAPQLLLQNNAGICERQFGLRLGEIAEGRPADMAIMDYQPPTPLSEVNFLGHLIFGLVDATVDTTVCRKDPHAEQENPYAGRGTHSCPLTRAGTGDVETLTGCLRSKEGLATK